MSNQSDREGFDEITWLSSVHCLSLYIFLDIPKLSIELIS